MYASVSFSQRFNRLTQFAAVAEMCNLGGLSPLKSLWSLVARFGLDFVAGEICTTANGANSRPYRDLLHTPALVFIYTSTRFPGINVYKEIKDKE